MMGVIGIVRRVRKVWYGVEQHFVDVFIEPVRKLLTVAGDDHFMPPSTDK